MRKLSIEEARLSISAHMQALQDISTDYEFAPLALSPRGNPEMPGTAGDSASFSPEIPVNIFHMGEYTLWNTAELRYLVDTVAA